MNMTRSRPLRLSLTSRISGHLNHSAADISGRDRHDLTPFGVVHEGSESQQSLQLICEIVGKHFIISDAKFFHGPPPILPDWSQTLFRSSRPVTA